MSFDATKKLPTVALIIASRRQAAVHSCCDKSHATDLLLFIFFFFCRPDKMSCILRMSLFAFCLPIQTTVFSVPKLCHLLCSGTILKKFFFLKSSEVNMVVKHRTRPEQAFKCPRIDLNSAHRWLQPEKRRCILPLSSNGDTVRRIAKPWNEAQPLGGVNRASPISDVVRMRSI